ncbi:glycosyltransferase family 2 protein [Candidatus Uhrbacteria bacterium]|nr:glycosyltransferase family 2 protein [Candidatus Uhrbacteria bacterium]
MRATVTISLVTYNSADRIINCLRSIRSQTYSNCNLVVLDNASSDDTAAIVEKHAPDAEVIRETRNTGFAAAHNRIIGRVSSDYILVLNDDCALEPDYVAALVEQMEQYRDAGSATGVLYRIGSLTGGFTRDIIDTLGLCINHSFYTGNIGSGARKSLATRDPFIVFGVSATAALYRREALEQCASLSGADANVKQYFDEQFFIYKEDADLAARLYRSGWNAYCVPKAEGYHVRSTKSMRFSRNVSWINQISYRNHLWFVFKNIAAVDSIRTHLTVCAYEAVKVFYLLICEPRTLRVLPDFFKGLPLIIKKRKKIFSSGISYRALPFSRWI